MNTLRLVRAQRAEPFYNLGAPGVEEFWDFEIDGQRLLPTIEKLTSDHEDVVTPLSDEEPETAVDCARGLLEPAGFFDEYVGADEVMLYGCPIDYDLLCGGVVATVTLRKGVAEWSKFRYVSVYEEGAEEATSVLSTLRFTFDRSAYERLLSDAATRFEALVPPRPPKAEPSPGALSRALRWFRSRQETRRDG